jgi:hypothetical protein
MPRALAVVLLCILILGAKVSSRAGQSSVDVDQAHTEWVAKSLIAMQGIKVGTTRADLLKIFTTEGGLSSASQRTYVYRGCPYIKLDVRFKASTREELPSDPITEVSRPYLAWTIMD